ncbi:MAG: nucleotide-diphospho-sugar transferase, partial [Marivirga sp.]|nr:nucleotide-diphospho-sugar transferase [Marivirga sp.]
MNDEIHIGSKINPEEIQGLETPVLLLIFNRPDTTRRVFEAIRKARPKRLFVAADGPRQHKPEDADRCAKARKIATDVDWECEVKTFFRDTNVGCGRGPSGGISWFFEHVDEGIILEDDCLPSPLFFRFCAELLERYRDDKRVMEIGGNTFMDEANRDKEYSYYFSSHNNIWGWATWKRAWAF